MAHYTKIKNRLFETQLGRCAGCACKFSEKNYVDDPRRQSINKIDRSLPISYDNSILLCGDCSGFYGNYASLGEFYEQHIVLGKRKQEKIQNLYLDTIPLINKFLIDLHKESKQDIQIFTVSSKSKYVYAPPENAEKIATSLFKQFVSRGNLGKTKKRNKMSSKKNNKCGLLEAQNHRCCYCHSIFQDHPESPRYATFEHVIPRKNKGTNKWSNLVIACALCNSLRDHLNMSAEDFYDWVQKNPQKIIEAERRFIWKRSQSLKWQKKTEMA